MNVKEFKKWLDQFDDDDVKVITSHYREYTGIEGIEYTFFEGRKKLLIGV